jgi:Tfp pilus assembly protein PilF
MAGLMAFAFWQMYQAKKARDALTAKVMAEYKRQQDVREAGIHIRNGQNYLQRKKYADAISEFDEAIKLDPYNPSPFHQKGYAYLRANQLADAIKTLQDLTTKIDPSYALGHFTLALAYQLNGDNANALKEARTTLDVNPAYCENFRKDLAYAWFVNSRDYEQRCVRNY